MATLEITEPDRRKSGKNTTGRPSSPNIEQNILHHNRASIGSCHDGGNSRRNSTGKSSSPNSGQNVVPHYLRASIGSCHDFCKYGRKHAFEGKAWLPIWKRITPPSDKEKPIWSVVPAVVKQNPVRTVVPAMVEQNPVRSVVPTEVKRNPIRKVVPAEVKQNRIRIVVVSSEMKGNPIGTVLPAEKEATVSAEKKKKATVTAEKKKATVSAEKKKAMVTAEKKATTVSAEEKNKKKKKAMITAEKKASMVKVKPSSVSKTHSPDPPEIIKREVLLPSKKVEVSSEQDYSNGKKMTGNEKKKIDMAAKRATSVKTKPLTVKPSPISYTSVGLSDRKNGDIKNKGTPKAAVKKGLASPTSSMSTKSYVKRVVSLNSRKSGSLKLVATLKDQNWIRKSEKKQSNDDKVQEKTLHVVNTETESKVLESVHSGGIIELPPCPKVSSPKPLFCSNSPSFLSSHEKEDQESEYTEYTDSEADVIISENDDIVNIVETSRGKRNWTPTKHGVVLLEDKDCAPVKLKFRRGKVVDLQAENKGPRRLRFRRGRVLGGNQDGKGDGRRRSFRNKGVDDDTKNGDASSENIVLRHQDEQQGKKDAQGLLNNVIEETASKLVESRKSKVKALVGAFETVISLHETKPSAQIVT